MAFRARSKLQKLQMKHRKGAGCLGKAALPAACNAFSGTGTFSNVKPLRASEPADEGMEAKARGGSEDSRLFPPLPCSMHALSPGRPLVRTLALGLCEGQETPRTRNVILSSLPTSNKDSKCLRSLPTVVPLTRVRPGETRSTGVVPTERLEGQSHGTPV